MTIWISDIYSSLDKLNILHPSLISTKSFKIPKNSIYQIFKNISIRKEIQK